MSTATGQLLASRDARLAARLSTLEPQLDRLGTVREGVLRRAVGLTLEAEGCEVPLGSAVRIEAQGGQFVEAEVVGFAGDKTWACSAASSTATATRSTAGRSRAPTATPGSPACR